MNDFNNLSPDKMNHLLKLAGNKLGKSPAELQREIDAGNANALLDSLDPKSREKVNNVLSNPETMQKLLQNDQLKGLLGKIMGGNNG